jgi:hypothetical protein
VNQRVEAPDGENQLSSVLFCFSVRADAPAQIATSHRKLTLLIFAAALLAEPSFARQRGDYSLDSGGKIACVKVLAGD